MSYRFDGLEREAEEIVDRLKEFGLMKGDFEVIGAIIFSKYKGEDDKLDTLLTDLNDLREEAEALLEKLKNKKDDK